MFAQPSFNSARAGADSRPRVLLAICLLLAVLLPISWRSVAPASPAAHAQPNLGSLPLTFIPTGDPATPCPRVWV